MATWSTAYINDLPDSAFLYIEDGGSKDSDGKTTPRSLRHFPYKDANGNVDLPHLRDALSRIPQSDLPADVKQRVRAKAEKILARHGGGDEKQTAEPVELFSMSAPLTHVEVRDPSANPDNTWTMSGYAAVFNEQATLRKIGDSELRVTIAPDAFDRVLQTQRLSQPDGVVHFNLGHDMNRVVAASNVPAGQPGSLILKVDAHGLHFLAKTAKDDPDAQKMAVGMRDGYIAQASMAFAVAPSGNEFSEISDDVVLRRINEIDMLMDVCATPQGVFSQTTSTVEHYAARLGQPTLSFGAGGHPRQLEDDQFLVVGVEGVIPVSTDTVGRVVKPRLSADELARIKGHLGRRGATPPSHDRS